jgi:hypothetical protein
MAINLLSWLANVPGSSRPWRVLAYDSRDEGGLPREFIVKHFRSDQRLARTVEYVAARFAYESGVHAIRPEIVQFSPEFLEAIQSLPVQPRDAHLAEPGVQVAFEWNHRAVCLMENHTALQRLEEPGQIGEIVGVDTVVINLDRSVQNVLFEPRADARGNPMHLLYPIDWELCFAGGSIESSTLRQPQLLESARPWPPNPPDPMCGLIRSRDDFDSAIHKLGGWTGARARLKLMLQGIPREWEVPEDTQEAILEFLVKRLRTTLARLKRPDDPEHVFPNWQNSLPLQSPA